MPVCRVGGRCLPAAPARARLPSAPACPSAADVEISYVDAILGTTVKVTTLGTNELSEVDLKIPAGAQPAPGRRPRSAICSGTSGSGRRAAPCAGLTHASSPCAVGRRHAAGHDAGDVEARRAQAGVQRPRRSPGAREGGCAAPRCPLPAASCRRAPCLGAAGSACVPAPAWPRRVTRTRHAPLQVKIPKSISGEERKLMEQLRELQGAKPASRGWF